MVFKKAIAFLLLAALLIPAMPAGAEALPIVLTNSLPEGMSGIYYATGIKALGEKPMVFRFIGSEGLANTFPEGMKLSESGVLSGTPGLPGDYQFAVAVTNPAGTTTAAFNFRIAPFDEEKLDKGGVNPNIIGAGNDPLTGLANGMNGGRITMQGSTVFFTDAKGYLYSLDAPFDETAARLFSAPAYANIDSNETTLYYYQRYLDNEATKTAGQSVFVTRIAQDPIKGKGRNTLMNLRMKDFSDLNITNEIVLYIGYDSVMGRIIIENKDAADLRTYYGGKEVKVDHALPYNGSAWYRQAGTGQLYRSALDGQLAIQLTEDKALCYTIAQLGDEIGLLYADAQQQLHSINLTNGDRQPVGTLKASALNANEEYVFFADANNKHRLSMFQKDAPGEIILLSDMPVDQIYAFENYVAFQKKGSKSLYLMALNSEGKAVLISK